MDKSRLYYQLPYVKSFMCTVEECRPGKDGTWMVALNQTGFYPEGGGQPSDTGTLDGVLVRYVCEKDGKVWHQVEAPWSRAAWRRALSTGSGVTTICSTTRGNTFCPV